jgi:tRNA-2-methylthio-N6-dimethylallyladenosine synthase
VGFHGEELADHESTLALMRTVGYDQAFTFKYSVREHTRAYRLGDTVSDEEKSRRLAEVIALQEATSLGRNRATIGQSFPVLVEGPARRGEGMLSGKTPQFKTAIFPDQGATAGATIAVRVESVTAHTLMCAVAG